jgi:hypothetical protein
VRWLAKRLPAPFVDEVAHRILYNRSPVGRLLLARQERAKLEKWEAAGRPPPPPDPIKHAIIRSYAQRFGLRTFVETGTFVGDTPDALQRDFDRIYTIELDGRLYNAARRRFRHHSHITVVQGDSSVVLNDLAPKLPEPALFWLDGHWSGGVTARGEDVSPVLRETATILDRNVAGDVLLIDDARLFGTEGYPSLDVLRQLVLQKREGWEFELESDVIRAHARLAHPQAAQA